MLLMIDGEMQLVLKSFELQVYANKKQQRHQELGTHFMHLVGII